MAMSNRFSSVLGAVFVVGLFACGSCERRDDPRPPVVQCGGLAGTPCPGDNTCVDDPTDTCDPARGGRDCGGVCQCLKQGLCVEGFTWSDRACACVPSARPPRDAGAPPPRDGGAAVRCGNNTCGAGEFCCNASCGICAPAGGACIQLFCEPDAGR